MNKFEIITKTSTTGIKRFKTLIGTFLFTAPGMFSPCAILTIIIKRRRQARLRAGTLRFLPAPALVGGLFYSTGLVWRVLRIDLGGFLW